MSTTELAPEVIEAFERRATRGSASGIEDVMAGIVAAGSAASAEADHDLAPIEDLRRSDLRRRTVLIAVAALVAIIVGTTIVLTRRQERPVDTITTPGPPPTNPGWHEIGRVHGVGTQSWPLTPVVAGDELVLAGAVEIGSGGAHIGATPVLDLGTGAMREVPPPDANLLVTRDGHAVVWTGAEVVVFGVEPRTPTPDSLGTPGARALDPRTGVWRSFPAPPTSVTEAFWTGSALLAVSPEGSVARWDPASNDWTMLTTTGPGFATHQYDAVWTGSSIVAAEWPTSEPSRSAMFDLSSNAWQVLPSLGFTPQTLRWTGAEVLAFDGSTGRLATLAVASHLWTERATAPGPRRATREQTVNVGQQLVVVGGWTGDAAAVGERPTDVVHRWDPAADQWSELPSLPPDLPGNGVVTTDGDRVLAIEATTDLHTVAILAFDLSMAGSSQLRAMPTATLGPTTATNATTATTGSTSVEQSGADLAIQPYSVTSNPRLVVSWLPDGFSARQAVEAIQGFVDRRPLHSFGVVLQRGANAPELLAAWQAKDRTRMATAATSRWTPLDGVPFAVDDLGGRPVLVQHVSDPDRDRLIVTLITGPDSAVVVDAMNMTTDEIDGVLRGLRVEPR